MSRLTLRWLLRLPDCPITMAKNQRPEFTDTEEKALNAIDATVANALVLIAKFKNRKSPEPNQFNSSSQPWPL